MRNTPLSIVDNCFKRLFPNSTSNLPSCRPEEAELFAEFAQHAYAQFRDKAAYSRSMPVDKMEENAQGRVWTGNDAASRGLVDAIGGMGRAIAIAKQKANIPQEKEVNVVELSRASTLLEILSDNIESTVDEVVRTLKVLHNMTSSEGVQARMDGIFFERMGETSLGNPVIRLLKAFLGSLLC
ncbi:hypothetical protein Cgig2_030812 [Carnegiea gigantea]|uniref:Peptidase S49 domain-containing protein n=1 Tax=Carnegiea gigantea TaxID=171969 RepID=A0A9Q1KU98_9CARY|nr:hypothetical protein Cgig2_030812 [Carnegiea gigantea]